MIMDSPKDEVKARSGMLPIEQTWWGDSNMMYLFPNKDLITTMSVFIMRKKTVNQLVLVIACLRVQLTINFTSGN